ncbi:MAG: hypothetical protein AAFW01_11335, partial [Pseudomonadota bacterium]
AAGGDDGILSIMMTISGTVIVDYDAGADSFEIATINGDSGLIESWIDGSVTRYMSCIGQGEDGGLDAPTRNLVAALPGSTGAYFVRLASISEQAAITFAREVAF